MKLRQIEGHDECKIGSLKYGTLVTCVLNARSSIYVKVKKRSCGAGVSVIFTRNYCVLLNIVHGTLREIPGDTVVKVIDGKLEWWHVDERFIPEYVR